MPALAGDATGFAGLAALTEILASRGASPPAGGPPMVLAGTINVLLGGSPSIPADVPQEVPAEAELLSARRSARSRDVLKKSESPIGFLARIAPHGAPKPQAAEPAAPAVTPAGPTQVSPAPLEVDADSRAAPVVTIEVGPPADIPAALVRLDASWRFHDTDVLAELGWTPGSALVFTRTANGVLIRRADADLPAGACASRVDSRGRVLVPCRLRRMMRLTQDTPLLIFADLGAGTATVATLPTIAIALKESA